MSQESKVGLSALIQTVTEYIIDYFQQDCDFTVSRNHSIVENWQAIKDSDLVGSAIDISGEKIHFTLFCTLSPELTRHFYRIYLMEEADKVDEETAYELASEVVNTIAGNITPLLAESSDDILEITPPMHAGEIEKTLTDKSAFRGVSIQTKEGEFKAFIIGMP